MKKILSGNSRGYLIPMKNATKKLKEELELKQEASFMNIFDNRRAITVYYDDMNLRQKTKKGYIKIDRTKFVKEAIITNEQFCRIFSLNIDLYKCGLDIEIVKKKNGKLVNTFIDLDYFISKDEYMFVKEVEPKGEYYTEMKE